MLNSGFGVLKTYSGFLSELLGHSRRDMFFAIALSTIAAAVQAVAILSLNQFVGEATVEAAALNRGDTVIAIVAFSLWFGLLPSFAYLISLSSARIVIAHRSRGTGVILGASKACWERLSAVELGDSIAPEDMDISDLLSITSRLRGMNLRLGLAVKSLTAVLSSLALLLGFTAALLLVQPIMGIISVLLASGAGFYLLRFKGRQMVGHQADLDYHNPSAGKKFTDLASQFLMGEIQETAVTEQVNFARSNKALQLRFTTPDMNRFLMGAATSASLGIVAVPLVATGFLVFSPTDLLLFILVFLAFLLGVSAFSGSLTKLMRFLPLLSLRNTLLIELKSCSNLDELSEIRKRIATIKSGDTQDS